MNSRAEAVAPLVTDHASKRHTTRAFDGAWTLLNPRPNGKTENVEKEAHQELKLALLLERKKERNRGRGGGRRAKK